MLSDAQTAGGLLITTSSENAQELLESLNKNNDYTSKIIGHLTELEGKNIFVN